MPYQGPLAAALTAITLVMTPSVVAQGLDDMKALSDQTQIMPDITGSWTFKTGPYNTSCHIRGRMYIYPQEQDGSRPCEFVTFEECPGLSAEVRQTCTARQEGEQIVIESKIKSIERQEPAAYGYAPDSWNLVVRSATEMVGTLESASRARALFTRDEIPLS